MYFEIRVFGCFRNLDVTLTLFFKHFNVLSYPLGNIVHLQGCCFKFLVVSVEGNKLIDPTKRNRPRTRSSQQ